MLKHQVDDAEFLEGARFGALSFFCHFTADNKYCNYNGYISMTEGIF